MQIKYRKMKFDTNIEQDMHSLQDILSREEEDQRAYTKEKLAALFKPNARTD